MCEGGCIGCEGGCVVCGAVVDFYGSTWCFGCSAFRFQLKNLCSSTFSDFRCLEKNLSHELMMWKCC